MQPHTDRPTTSTAPQRGDEDELYQRHHQALLIAVVARRSTAARAADRGRLPDRLDDPLAPPTRPRLRLRLALRRRDPRGVPALGHRATRRAARGPRQDGDWAPSSPAADRRRPLEALEALRALAALPERQRLDLALRSPATATGDRRHDRRPDPHQRQQVAGEGARPPDARRGRSPRRRGVGKRRGGQIGRSSLGGQMTSSAAEARMRSSGSTSIFSRPRSVATSPTRCSARRGALRSKTRAFCCSTSCSEVDEAAVGGRRDESRQPPRRPPDVDR